MASQSPAPHNTYTPGHTQVKHHEWRTAENSAAYLLPTLESLAKSKPEIILLDIGCGSGTITTSLAKHMPRGSITAVDISPDILTKAAEHAEQQGVTNIVYQTANIYTLPFEDETFDVVHASMVLSHLDAPAEAYREMLRVTKSDGGVVANRESDLTMWSCYPEPPVLRRYHEVQVALMRASGGQVQAGPRLVSWAMEAGARREQITASFGTWTYSTPEEREIWG